MGSLSFRGGQLPATRQLDFVTSDGLTPRRIVCQPSSGPIKRGQVSTLNVILNLSHDVLNDCR